MFGVFFTEAESVRRFADVNACDLPRFQRFFHAMLEKGVYLAPSAYEAGFVSAAHSEADLQATIKALHSLDPMPVPAGFVERVRARVEARAAARFRVSEKSVERSNKAISPVQGFCVSL